MQPSACDCIIRNATIATVDAANTVRRDGMVAIKDGVIVAVGDDSSTPTNWHAPKVIDCRGAIVHPGFIDAHIHVSQYSARSAVAALERARLTQGHWKAELRPEDEHASAAAAAVDYVRSGHTGF